MGGDQSAGDGPRTRYMYVVDEVTSRIETGHYTQGQRLPPEKDLAAELGVAYMTVRRAMEILRERGLVVTIWGLGTFIRDGGRR